MRKEHYYVWASGLIEKGKKVPAGALPLTVPDPEKLYALARHSRYGDDLLVPGVPEAESDRAAVDALLEFQNQLRERGGNYGT